jgi:hypothetical protein
VRNLGDLGDLGDFGDLGEAVFSASSQYTVVEKACKVLSVVEITGLGMIEITGEGTK